MSLALDKTWFLPRMRYRDIRYDSQIYQNYDIWYPFQIWSLLFASCTWAIRLFSPKSAQIRTTGAAHRDISFTLVAQWRHQTNYGCTRPLATTCARPIWVAYWGATRRTLSTVEVDVIFGIMFFFSENQTSFLCFRVKSISSRQRKIFNLTANV